MQVVASSRGLRRAPQPCHELLLDDGSITTGLDGAGDSSSDSAASQFLAHRASSSQFAAMQPLDFDAFSQAIGHARIFSLGPDGLLYSVWVAAGESGYRVPDKAYVDLLHGAPPLPEINRSLAVYILRIDTCMQRTTSGRDRRHQDALSQPRPRRRPA